MTEEEQMHTGGGISRRDIMKRSAVVGGAMVWATPLVQTMARPAFAQVGTPEFLLSSFVAMVVTCDGVTYRVKWEKDGEQWDSSPGPDDCTDPNNFAEECTCQIEGWADATPADGGELGIEATIDGDIVTFDLGDCTFEDGRAKDKNDECRTEGEDVEGASIAVNHVTFKV